MSGESKSQKINLLAFIGMTCALVASVRNIPGVSAAGWTMVFYMAVSVLLYALPISLISGEYAGMFPGDGGPELWVTSSLGEKWGFVTSWLLWVQMFPGMVMVASALAPTLAGTVGMPELEQNNIFTLACILVVYWAVTLLNFKYDMAKIGGKIGVWLGLYIPVAALLVLGLAALAKTGLDPKSVLGRFSAGKLVLDSETVSSLKYLLPIMFVFTGIEMSSVYITRLENPTKNYFRGVISALVFMALFNVVNGFLLADAVEGKLELDNIAQGLAVYCRVLGLPPVLVNIFCLMVFIGFAVQLSAWATGPSKTITASARRGLYPPRFGFWNTNGHDVSVSILLTQATVISIFALSFLLIPEVNEAFLLLVSTTTVVYSIVYLIMGAGILKLRKSRPDLARPFRIGKKGDALIWIITAVMFATVVISTAASLLAASAFDAFAELIMAAALFIAPLIIYRYRKPSWKTDVKKMLGE